MNLSMSKLIICMIVKMISLTKQVNKLKTCQKVDYIKYISKKVLNYQMLIKLQKIKYDDNM